MIDAVKVYLKGGRRAKVHTDVDRAYEDCYMFHIQTDEGRTVYEYPMIQIDHVEYNRGEVLQMPIWG